MNSGTTSFKVCPQCRSTADLNAVYCVVCGHNFQTQYHQPPQGSYPGYPRHPQAQPHWDPYAGGYRPDSNRLIITLLLWFFIGHFGAHRFYLGHINTAVVMLVLELIGFATMCFLVGYIFIIAVAIWWLIDLIMILTGQLTPTDGSRII